MRGDAVRLVVVDDMHDVADALAMQLQLDGYLAFATYSTEQAVIAIEELQPDGVLFDIRMPGLDGHELATLLRHRYKNQIVLVAVTGTAETSDRVSATMGVADHCFRKPLDIKLLREIFGRPPTHPPKP